MICLGELEVVQLQEEAVLTYDLHNNTVTQELEIATRYVQMDNNSLT